MGKVKEKRKKGKCKHIYLIIDHFQVGHHNDFHHKGWDVWGNEVESDIKLLGEKGKLKTCKHSWVQWKGRWSCQLCGQKKL